jgi:nitrous oxidase accessory protein NosD
MRWIVFILQGRLSMKPKYLHLFVVAVICLAPGCSKNPSDPQESSLRGIATFEGQQDHSGIVVQIQELDVQATTTASGNYSFASLPAGTYTLLASDADAGRLLYDFAIAKNVSVAQGRESVAPTMELPSFQRIDANISTGTRWTPEEGPYLITNTITVLPGADLSIDPGTIVKFAGYYRLIVQGKLAARGTAVDSILFTAVDLDAEPGQWDRISIEGMGTDQPDTLMYCRIQYANIGVTSSQARPVVRRNTISHCAGYGLVSTASTVEIYGNHLHDNYGGISCENGSDGIVQANVAEANTTVGIACAGSSPEICDNIISNSPRGFQGQSEADPLVWHNRFESNEIAIYLFYYCDPQIEANVFSDQQRFGLHLVGYNSPRIHFNNILQNGDYDIFMKDQPDDVHAENNWWDTTNPNEVSDWVWDGQDDSRLGLIFLAPIQNAPVDTAGPRAG